MNASTAHPSMQTPPKNTQERAEDGLRGDWGELVVTNKPFSLSFFFLGPDSDMSQALCSLDFFPPQVG